MGNMSYCRFANTLSDLIDCRHAIMEEDEADLSESERRAMKRLIEVCQEIVEFKSEESDELE